VAGHYCVADRRRVIDGLQTPGPKINRALVSHTEPESTAPNAYRDNLAINDKLRDYGIERWGNEPTDGNTSDARVLAKIAVERGLDMEGAITINGPIKDAQGQDVYPCEIQSGRVISIMRSTGAVVGRIAEVTKTGELAAAVTLSDERVVQRRRGSSNRRFLPAAQAQQWSSAFATRPR